MKIKGSTALVTGANRGLGLAYAKALLAAGAKVQDGWLAWLERQSAPPALSKARIAELLRRYGAVA